MAFTLFFKMRVKQLAIVLPVSKVKLFWDRLTFSKLTTAYFIFSLIHCIIQVSLQIRAFTINKDAASFLYSISVQANATDNRIPVLGNGDLQLCPDVPTRLNDYTGCQVIWNGTAKSNSVAADANAPSYSTALAAPSSSAVSTTSLSSSTALSSLALSTNSVAPLHAQAVNGQAAATPVVITQTITPTVTIVVAPTAPALVPHDDLDLEDVRPHSKRFHPEVLVFDEGGVIKVIIKGDGFNNVEANLSESCPWSLNYPVSILDNTKREDIVFIAFQFWVLGMSIVALLNESIPHMIASLLTHILATTWSGLQLNHTANFRATFNRVITNGACNGVALLPSYWDERADAEYPALVLNVVALLISAFLTWKLVKSFGWQTFKRVGASLTINRIYKLVLVLSIVLQLSFFFMGATVSLWLDDLFNGAASRSASYVAFYKATSFATLVLLIPWIATGWFAVRQELRLPMFIFLVLSLLYLGAWALMFLADTFRWAFLTWLFFTLMASASVFLTLVAFILGVICRYNFGKGLPRYLNAQEPLPGDDFTPVKGSDLEKVDFPSNEKPIPTFSATFGSGSEVPPPSQMFSASRGRLGPRFFNPSAEPFESPPEGLVISAPSPALTRESSSHSHSDSFGTLHSYYSYSSSPGKQRWLIE